MAAFIRKNLTFSIFNHASKSTNIHFYKSPVSLSVSLHFFSSKTSIPLDSNHSIVYDVLVHKHEFPCAFASRVASELSRMKNPEQVDSMLTFLKSSGFSIAQLQKILNHRPRYLCYSLDKCIKPKIKGLHEEGFSSTDISLMISSNPRILRMSLKNSIIPSLSVLKGLLGTNTAVVTVLKRSPRLLSCNFERTVLANVEFLKSCGLSMDRIRCILLNCPQAFCVNAEVNRASAEKAKEMGLSEASKAFVYAVITISARSKELWELKFQSFLDVGFSESEILSMFKKEPRVFGVSSEKTKRITEGLVATGRYDLSRIAEEPLSLLFSFEKRYEPRIKVLRILESRNLIESWPTLSTFCRMSDVVFLSSFISPYLDHLKLEMKN